MSVPIDPVPVKTPLAIAVLCGGKSSRMGMDKSFVPLRGRPLIEHTLSRLEVLQHAHRGTSVLLVTNNVAAYAYLGLPTVTDILPGCGSLGGLYSALWHSPGQYTLCVACDMPFLNPDLLEHLVSEIESGYGVVPRMAGRSETLHAIYSKDCLDPFRAALDAHQFKIHQVIETLPIRYIETDTLRHFDPDLRSFMNINTPEDLACANQFAIESANSQLRT